MIIMSYMLNAFQSSYIVFSGKKFRDELTEPEHVTRYCEFKLSGRPLPHRKQILRNKISMRCLVPKNWQQL